MAKPGAGNLELEAFFVGWAGVGVAKEGCKHREVDGCMTDSIAGPGGMGMGMGERRVLSEMNNAMNEEAEGMRKEKPARGPNKYESVKIVDAE